MRIKFFKKLYRPYIRQKLDIRKPSIKAETVGVCLANCLDVFAKEPRFNRKKAWDKKWQALEEEQKLLKKKPDSKPKVGLRFILIKQAHKFLEKNGLLIMEGVREAEIKYSLALGYSLRAYTKPSKDKDSDHKYFDAVVLQK